MKFYYLLFLFSFLSCQDFIDRQLHNEANANYTSPYQGKWIGSYVGDANGNLVLIVLKSGTIEVTRTYNTNNSETYHTEVYDNGAFYNNASQNSGFTLYGNLSTQSGNPSGTWKQGSSTGTWYLTKQ